VAIGISSATDLFRAHILLVSQNENSSSNNRKRADELLQPTAEQWIAPGCRTRQIRQFGQFIPVHRHLRPASPAADAIDGAMHGDPAQPIKDVLFRGELAKFAVQFEEDILGRFFGRGSIAEDAESDAEDHGLVFQHQVAKALIVVFESACQWAT
jgi:hypothetical protein